MQMTGEVVSRSTTAGDGGHESVDLDVLRAWLGRTAQDEDVIGLRQAKLMAATIDYAQSSQLRDGVALPPLWHWLYFLSALPERELGRDGHPARGSFLPPVALPNRMRAGGRIEFLAPIAIGSRVRRTSRIHSIDYKHGRSGDLVFVTVENTLESVAGERLLREESDIVYRSAGRLSKKAPSAEKAPEIPSGALTQTLKPTSTTLFRYSALTFNGHRIHYDADYCREVEGYDAQVIHGPLNATLMAGLAAACAVNQGRVLRDFSYRGLAPAILGDTMRYAAWPQDNTLIVEARLSSGVVCMRAEARLA